MSEKEEKLSQDTRDAILRTLAEDPDFYGRLLDYRETREYVQKVLEGFWNPSLRKSLTTCFSGLPVRRISRRIRANVIFQG
jgi:hypothetical protein